MSELRERLDEQQRRSQLALRERVAAQLAAMLEALPDLDDDSLNAYATTAYPLVAGGQRAAADRAAGYAIAVARTLGHKMLRDEPIGLDTALLGVIVTPESRSLFAPVLRARSVLSDGGAYTEAIGQASSYAELLSTNDLLAAQRVGVERGASVTDGRVRGYRKVLAPGACQWCRDVSGANSATGKPRVYPNPDRLPFHERDKCAFSPVFEGE